MSCRSTTGQAVLKQFLARKDTDHNDTQIRWTLTRVVAATLGTISSGPRRGSPRRTPIAVRRAVEGRAQCARNGTAGSLRGAQRGPVQRARASQRMASPSEDMRPPSKRASTLRRPWLGGSIAVQRACIAPRLSNRWGCSAEPARSQAGGSAPARSRTRERPTTASVGVRYLSSLSTRL